MELVYAYFLLSLVTAANPLSSLYPAGICHILVGRMMYEHRLLSTNEERIKMEISLATVQESDVTAVRN